MEDQIIDTLDDIIEKIENNEHNGYYHNEKTNKFHIIEKSKQGTIDIEAKLGINNFYIRDNVLDFNYIFSKRYLDDKINIQNIYIDDGYDKKYYCFLENETFVNLIACSCVKNKCDILCKNNIVFGKSFEEILEYAKKTFAEFLQEENENYGLYKIEEKEDEYEEDIEEDFEEDIEECEYEENEHEEDSDNAEQELDDEEDDISIMLDIYKNYELKIDGVVNNNEIKTWLMMELETDVEHAFYNSILIKDGIENLKMVIEAERKRLKDEKVL